MKKVAIMLAGAVALAGCYSKRSGRGIDGGAEGVGLRAPSESEKGADFDQMVALFKNYYAPYQYKEKNLNIDIDQIAIALRPKALAAKTDEEFAGYIMQFGGALKDGHVQIRVENSSSGISAYSVPITLTTVESRVLIGEIDKDLENSTKLSAGDEVLEIDGQAPLSLLPVITKYKSFATELSNQQLILKALKRPSYMTDLVPTSGLVSLKVKKAGGTVETGQIPWVAEKYNSALMDLAPIAGLDRRVYLGEPGQRHLGQMGQVDPIFLTEQTKREFGFTKVYPTAEARKKYELGENDAPPIYAALYRYSGKTILLVRQPSYHHEAKDKPKEYSNAQYMKAYMALFDEYQALADIMVLDQTHNGGGSYCEDFYQLFARDTDVPAAALLRADRRWINSLKIMAREEEPEGKPWDLRMIEQYGSLVEKAYDEGRFLSDPVLWDPGFFSSRKKAITWTKPMLVLVDELSGSCADLFPMLVKANGRAKLFGQTTMGAGGNVEEVGVLNNSRIHISMTRSQFYPYNPTRGPLPEEMVEGNGVTPDFVYSHTVDDVRAGYVKYVRTFSDKAVEVLGGN